MAFLENILYIIVTYRERYWEVQSYNSLIESYIKSNPEKPLCIFIADNTDLENWDCNSYGDLRPNINIIYQKYNNPGLSYAYNKGVEFAKKNGYSWVVLLDQDTTLPMNFYPDYEIAIQNSKIPLKAPITIIGNNKILSPSKYIGYRSYLYSKIDKGSKRLPGNSFINTGMMINTDFFLTVGGYNESIRLDFTDHDFLYRCKQFTDRFEVLNVKVNQDFSSFTNTKAQALNRYHLYLRDLQSFKKGKKNRISIFINSDFLRLLKLSIQYKSLDFIKIRIKRW